MSDKSRSRAFWQGTSGSIAARVLEKRRQEKLQGEMAIARIKARYDELKGRQS
jgi:hypothetical protein